MANAADDAMELDLGVQDAYTDERAHLIESITKVYGTTSYRACAQTVQI